MQTIERAASLDLTQVSLLGNDILGKINQVREIAPVIWSDSAGAWIVSRHADVLEAFSGRMPLSNVRFTRLLDLIPEAERQHRIPHVMKSVPMWIVNIDPPQHTRIRKLLTRAFSKKVIEGVRPFARATIARVLDQAGEKREVEFINQVARAVTGRVIMSILGVGAENLPRLQAWSIAMNSFGNAQPVPSMLDDMETAMAEMDALFTVEIEKRRRHPTGDFISEMVEASEGEDALSDDEIRNMCQVTLIAGHDTTMNTMGLSAVALARNADAREYLREHPQDPNAIMEVMRYVAMSTMMARVVSADFEWHGQQLRTGDVVFLMIAGANRDPRTFADPDRIDMTRATDQVMVFGSGLHHCIGHLLAKMQLGEFLPALVRRFDIEILDEPLQFTNHLVQRGLARLNVRLYPLSPA
ncbi:MAG: cytochrome P450 [Steroidobacteraceae bacterium]